MARPFEHTGIEMKRLGPPVGESRRELLFMHGAWHGPWCWEPLAEPLAAEGWGCNLLALPGHGDGPWELPCSTSLMDYALYAARAAAQLPSPVLIGHSMGGWIVQKLLEAADLPAVLLCPLPATGLAFTRLLALTLHHPLIILGAYVGRPVPIKDPAMARRLFYDQMGEDELRQMWQRLVPEPAWAALQMGMKLCWARPKAGHQPRLVIAAQNDFFMPAAATRRTADKLGARYEFLGGMPHNPWLEDPEGRVLGLLRDFLGALESE